MRLVVSWCLFVRIKMSQHQSVGSRPRSDEGQPDVHPWRRLARPWPRRGPPQNALRNVRLNRKRRSPASQVGSLRAKAAIGRIWRLSLLRSPRRRRVTKSKEEMGDTDRAVARRQIVIALMLGVEVRGREQDRRPLVGIASSGVPDFQRSDEFLVGERVAQRRDDFLFRVNQNSDHSGDGLPPAVDAIDEPAEAVLLQIMSAMAFEPTELLKLEHEFDAALVVVPSVDNVGAPLLSELA